VGAVIGLVTVEHLLDGRLPDLAEEHHRSRVRAPLGRPADETVSSRTTKRRSEHPVFMREPALPSWAVPVPCTRRRPARAQPPDPRTTLRNRTTEPEVPICPLDRSRNATTIWFHSRPSTRSGCGTTSTPGLRAGARCAAAPDRRMPSSSRPRPCPPPTAPSNSPRSGRRRRRRAAPAGRGPFPTAHRRGEAGHVASCRRRELRHGVRRSQALTTIRCRMHRL
jgi:hypothetical protein